jgi:hypothetical protein
MLVAAASEIRMFSPDRANGIDFGNRKPTSPGFEEKSTVGVVDPDD